MSTRIFIAFAAFCGIVQAQVTIVNNASFRGDQPVTAGSWVAAFGTFDGVPTTTATTLPLPTNLGGVTIKVDGVDAPLYDVRNLQLTFLIPYAMTPGVHPVVVTTPSGTQETTVRVITAAPGLFTLDAQSPPRGAVLNQDGVTVNGPNALSHRGEFISIYGTGPGIFDHPVTDGAVPGFDPLIHTVSTPQVFIGGVESPVDFSGLNPNAPGLWQINVKIPDLPFITGARVPVIVFVDGVDSNEVTISVE